MEPSTSNNIQHLNSIQIAITNEIAKAIAELGGGSGIISIVQSWGDTLPEEEVLDQLIRYNKKEFGT